MTEFQGHPSTANTIPHEGWGALSECPPLHPTGARVPRGGTSSGQGPPFPRGCISSGRKFTTDGVEPKPVTSAGSLQPAQRALEPLATTALSADVAATAGETSPTSPSCGGTVATPPSSCMAEVDPLLPARRASTPPPTPSYATPSSEYVQTVATRVVYSRGYGAFYVSLLAASITEIVWIFHPWTDHCCRSTRTRPACAAHSPPIHEFSP